MRLNIFNKKRYMKESEEKKIELSPEGIEAFIKGLNEFMRNPPLKDYKVQNKGKNIDGIEIDYSQYINFIKKVWKQALGSVGIDANNEGISIRINKFTKSSVTFKIFIYNKNSSKEDLLKHSRSSDFKKITSNIENDNNEEIQVDFLDTGYGKSDIPNFYFEDPNTEKETLYAKKNGKLLKVTEAAESLVALYFNYLNEKDITTFDNKPLTAEELRVENIPSTVDINNIKEAIKVICTDREWNLSCKANALGILKFLGDQIRKEFTAKHPCWDGQKEKNIVINEYLDPSDIFLVIEGDDNFVENYKEKCKSRFIKDNPRTLGVSLKKLKAASNEIVEQDKPPEKVFKTPNFFLTGWKVETSPKVIYKKNPTDLDLKSNNYFVSNVSVTVSSSGEDGTAGKTMYFKCDVNGEKELLFTIRKNGGENFVLESAGSEGTESQGGKCTPLIHFVLGKEFINTLNFAIKNFESAQYELKKIAITNGKKGNTDIVENELAYIDDVLQRINDLQSFTFSKKSVKRAAIAFAFAKKLPFLNLGNSTTDIEDAYKILGFDGTYSYKDFKAASPIYLGLGKDAYYSGN